MIVIILMNNIELNSSMKTSLFFIQKDDYLLFAGLSRGLIILANFCQKLVNNVFLSNLLNVHFCFGCVGMWIKICCN